MEKKKNKENQARLLAWLVLDDLAPQHRDSQIVLLTFFLFLIPLCLTLFCRCLATTALDAKSQI